MVAGRRIVEAHLLPKAEMNSFDPQWVAMLLLDHPAIMIGECYLLDKWDELQLFDICKR